MANNKRFKQYAHACATHELLSEIDRYYNLHMQCKHMVSLKISLNKRLQILLDEYQTRLMEKAS